MTRGDALPFFTLLLILVGYAPTAGAAECIPENKTVSLEENTTVVSSEEVTDDNKMILVKRYVYAETDFKGVNVKAEIEAEVNGMNQTVHYSQFVQGNDKCFKRNKWMEADMWVDLKYTAIEFRIGECRQKCKMNVTNINNITRPTILSITAMGPSSWAMKLNEHCSRIKRTHVSVPPQPPSCVQEIPQPPTIPKTPSALSMWHWMVVVGVVVVTVVVVAVMTVCWRKSRRAMAAEEKTIDTETVATENSIYEPFDQVTQAVSNPVYEHENDVYEPFSENIYENINSQQTPAGSCTVHVIENDVYEPFSYGGKEEVTPGVKDNYENTDADEDTYDKLDFGNWDEKR